MALHSRTATALPATRIRPARQVVAATYNIHRCIGSDGRYSPARIAAVLEELDADIIGLQEVDICPTAGGGRDQLSFLADRLGFYAAAGLNIVRQRAHYGNALLSRWPILSSRLVDLTAPGGEPRGAVDSSIALPAFGADAPARAIVTHFGLRAWERRRQMAALLKHIVVHDHESTVPLLVMGDFNEWVRFGPISRGLRSALTCAGQVTSFPARCPLFPLDRICSRALTLSCEPARHVSDTSRVASDHLPVKAVFTVATGSS